MGSRVVILLALALVVAGGTVFAARSWLAQRTPAPIAAAPAPAKDEAAYVLVARTDLPAGQFVLAEHLRWQAWPDEELAETYLVKGEHEAAELHGAVVRRGIAAGEPIARGAVVKPGERGFLAAVLRPGFRAVSVPVDAVAGVSGLVFPGDRVDLILSQTITDPRRPELGERQASETVLENVRILAIDQRVEDQGDEPKLAKTATLEVQPRQAEALAVIRELGILTLSLRSLARDDEELARILAGEALVRDEPDPVAGNTSTWDSQASRLVPRRVAQVDLPKIVVGRGSQSTQVSIGGENKP